MLHLGPAPGGPATHRTGQAMNMGQRHVRDVQPEATERATLSVREATSTEWERLSPSVSIQSGLPQPKSTNQKEN